MEIVRATSGSSDSPSPISHTLPPALLDKAAERLCWISLLCAATTVIFLALEQTLQVEARAMLALPAIRLTMLGIVFLTAGIFAVQRNGWVKKETMLDLGIVFQISISFAIAMFETSMKWNPNEPVMGHSGVAIWLSICGLLLPNAPLKAGIAAFLSASMWPAAYFFNLNFYGFEALPGNRLAVWIIPNYIMAVWMYILNSLVFKMQLKEVKAEELGSYQLDYLIGKGGMGEVWRAKHKMLARDAAIKLIRKDVLSGLNARQEKVIRGRFEREARATASLKSPHTVALYDFGRTKDDTFYYVMELLDGIDLQTMVERYGPLPPGRVLNILIQASDSLEEAHRAGLVHRDIKPKNILLAKLGLQYDVTKVLDFGLVKSKMSDDMSVMTLDGTATGTPAYLPPEIALGDSQVDGRADLYSLGCVAYYLLTGQLVFTETNSTALALAHVQKEPVPPSQRTELPIPVELEAIIMKLLAKKPEDRLRSAQELQRQLRLIRPRITSWCEDLAANWWHTNLPETAANSKASLREDEQPTHISVQSPVSLRA